MSDLIKIVNDIKSRNFKPIYFLCGEETYYIDQISDLIEDTVLTEDQKGFDQIVMYGRDTTVDEIIGVAKRYPMLSEYQVVIVKEAQNLAKTIENIVSYVENPQPTTILVIAYRSKPDARKSYIKKIKDKHVYFESNKLKEYQIPDWIIKVVKEKGYDIDTKAAAILAEFLGTDLGKINNELEKLQIIFPKGHKFTAHNIEENIGFSKDFNFFELKNALSEKNAIKAYQIIHHFAQNPKDNPLVVVNSNLFNFFSQLLVFHGLKDKSSTNVAKVLGVNPYFVKDYTQAAKLYPMKKVSNCIEIIKDSDLKSKGVNSNSLSEGDILKEMVYKILN